MNNLLFASLLVLLATQCAFAQKDTSFTTVGQESGGLESQRYLTQYEQAFRTMTPSKWMFKWDAAKLIPREENNAILSNTAQLSIGAERKISEALSIGGNYTFAKGYGDYDFEQGYDWITIHQVAANLKWYYKMKKKIQEGRGTNNFSGNYIGVQSAFARRTGASLYIASEIYSELQLTARYGIQRRLLKHSFIDLSYGIGALYRPETIIALPNNGWSFTTNQQFSIGLAHFSPRKQEDNIGGFCDVLRCFDEDKRMLKVDLFNVANVSELSVKSANLALQPSISLEQKLGKLPFSVELETDGTVGYSRYSGYHKYADWSSSNPKNYRYSAVSGAVQGELRWYYNQKRRIMTGKSGNNLSGPFLAVNAEQSWGRTNVSGYYTIPDYEVRDRTSTVRVVWGFQQRIFNNAFVQFKTGIAESWNIRTYNTPSSIIFYDEGRNQYIKYFTELKVGLAF